jgi:uncharacterized protein YbaA (DUF1428 family)
VKYIDCYLIPIKPTRKADYIEVAARTSKVLIENGALRTVETWQDVTPQDPAAYHATDTREAHAAENDSFRTFNDAADTNEDEVVVLSWVEWPDKATRDKGLPKAMADPRMHAHKSGAEAFDGRRVIANSFEVIVELNNHQ